MPETDKTLPENSKENLDRKLDHAIEETFPTRDPVSVTITQGGPSTMMRRGSPSQVRPSRATRAQRRASSIRRRKLPPVL